MWNYKDRWFYLRARKKNNRNDLDSDQIFDFVNRTPCFMFTFDRKLFNLHFWEEDTGEKSKTAENDAQSCTSTFFSNHPSNLFSLTSISSLCYIIFFLFLECLDSKIRWDSSVSGGCVERSLMVIGNDSFMTVLSRKELIARLIQNFRICCGGWCHIEQRQLKKKNQQLRVRLKKLNPLSVAVKIKWL